VRPTAPPATSRSARPPRSLLPLPRRRPEAVVRSACPWRGGWCAPRGLVGSGWVGASWLACCAHCPSRYRSCVWWTCSTGFGPHPPPSIRSEPTRSVRGSSRGSRDMLGSATIGAAEKDAYLAHEEQREQCASGDAVGPVRFSDNRALQYGYRLASSIPTACLTS
jgi:hypothetical protein